MTRSLLLLSACVVVAGCSREVPAVVTSAPAPAPPPPPRVPSANEALEQMDTRAPVPLLPMMANHQKQNMRDHLVAVQEIIGALATDDFGAIEKAAGRIGFSDQMGQMCTHMGAGAPGFTEQALAFHHTADRVGEAARRHDKKRVVAELSATLQTCTACHAAWRQQVVDEPTWTRLTSSAAPPGAGHQMPH
jgi:hypothetical protein